MAKMHPMVSLELDDDEQYDAVPIMGAKPRFPYGTRISLTEKELEKMKLDHADAVVGGMIHLHAMARITSVSENDTDQGKCCRIELQIEDMCVESEDEENEIEEAAEDRSARRRRMYR